MLSPPRNPEEPPTETGELLPAECPRLHCPGLSLAGSFRSGRPQPSNRLRVESVRSGGHPQTTDLLVNMLQALHHRLVQVVCDRPRSSNTAVRP